MPEAYLRDNLAGCDLPATASADDLLLWAQTIAKRASPEQIYRHKEGRKTLQFSMAGRSYFLKLHAGIGWGEIIKNLLQARLPILGAGNEYRAVMALKQIGVDTMSVAAYASRAGNPAALESMIVTDDLVGTVSLEAYCADWISSPPEFNTRIRLIRKLADSARKMHDAGINHRDFYICHFHLDEGSLADNDVRCHLIDLHRAQIRQKVPRRWQVKDLAGLYFSAMDCGLGRRDLLRFMHHYTKGGLRQALGRQKGLWQRVERRAARLYLSEHGCAHPNMK